MIPENQTMYRIETAAPLPHMTFDPPHIKVTLGYATGDPEDLRQFYEATGKNVNIVELTVPHITAHDAKERVRLEDMLKVSSNQATAVGPIHRQETQR